MSMRAARDRAESAVRDLREALAFVLDNPGDAEVIEMAETVMAETLEYGDEGFADVRDR